ncbi:MAG: hypothetical protein P8Z36_15325 [Gemmatimonadota bacterium]
MSDVETAQNARADAFLRRAEQLVRSLSGIADARIYDDGRGGIRAIDVMPRPDNTAARAARNVQSALLAAFGTGVDLGRIRVRPPQGPPRDEMPRRTGLDDARAEPAVVPDVPVQDVAEDEPPLDEDEDDELADDANAADVAPSAAHGDPPKNGNGTGQALAAVALEDEEAAEDRRAGPRLVSLDIVRHASGSVACIVAVVVDTEVRRASVEALDLPGAAEHAAAQAVIRAVGAGLELEGVRHVEIAGQDYVIVAARDDARGRKRAAATLVARSAAHAAADAATRAARALKPAPTP